MLKSSSSQHAFRTLLVTSALGCGLILLASRLTRYKNAPPVTDLKWKSAAFAGQVAFSSDGRSLTLMGTQCQRFEVQTGRLLSSWKPPLGALVTPDGASVISFDEGKKTRVVNSTRIWETTTNSYPQRHIHSRPIKLDIYTGRALLSLYAKNGTLQWKQPLPDDTSSRLTNWGQIRWVSNSFVIFRQSCLQKPAFDSNDELLRFSRRDGKLLNARAAPISVTPYNNETFTFDSQSNLHFAAREESQKAATLKLVSPTSTRTYEVLPDLKPYRLWRPLVFDAKEQLTAGTRSIGNSFTNDGDIGTLYLWDSQGKLKWTDRKDQFSAEVMSFSPDSRYLAVGGNNWKSLTNRVDGRLFVYEVATGKVVKEFSETTFLDQAKRPFTNYLGGAIPGYSGPVTGLAWSPDGSLLGATYDSGGFKLWKVK